ncbi:hypothetical protein DFA_09289 [Cavenderia fasciculata]|uniref:Uncharacterized protein n=1 Tax=Cavenderia fasciculata TaxID=261658 RepID=F4Q777_CACFS|nr:uncharacterized protein DFA_09289 [Cavenderia fasciculata]EGG16259.1 hypothetical protein DFA_09289 [Cavenderia fasciculata]|eukprot:XP_004354643.1 hypothetical protein DFA_09289 [Cavenderia fasciculata]
MNENKSSSSSSSSPSLSLSPRGGLSDLTLLQIINDLEFNQDIVCLLMTCKAYYREFKKQYAKVITFKGIEYPSPDERTMISSRMTPFKEIYNASLMAIQTKKDHEINNPPPQTWISLTKTSVDAMEKINTVKDRTKLTRIHLNEFTGNIKDVLLPSIDTLSINIKSVLPRFPTRSQWTCFTLTSLSIYSDSVLPSDLQFPPTLTDLCISFNYRDPFTLDMTNLVDLRTLDVSSSSITLIPATNIRFPNPNTSLSSLTFKVPFDRSTITQSFLPPNLEELNMDYKYLGEYIKPPPHVKTMNMSTNIGIGHVYFPLGLLDVKLTLNGMATLGPWTFPQGIEIVDIPNTHIPVTPEFIPDSVKYLCADVSNPDTAVFPSCLETFVTSTSHDSPFNYPPTLKELEYQKGDYPPPVIYLPTSLETITLEIFDPPHSRVFALPTTKVINNDNSPPEENPPHFVLPYRVKKLEASLLGEHETDFSFRIDTIINCSNVEHLFIDNFGTTLDLYIRRLENGDVMINSGGRAFFGGVYRQQRRMDNTSVENRSFRDFPALYLTFKEKGGYVHVYPSNIPIKLNNTL